MLGLVTAGVVIYTLLTPPVPREKAKADRETAAAVPPAAPPAPAPGVRPAPAPAEAKEPAAPPPVAEPAPAPETATLSIDSDVPGASVFIDRVYLGTTPLTAKITPGPHRINASATGYEGIAENIDVVAGPRDIMLRFKEIRLDVRVDVTHKHGVGSCAGTLSGSPQGIKYVTPHAGDAFDVPLADITALDLDFLAKNLRLRLKSGKTYNFTETGGGADQLYNFHRDVNKARATKN